MSHWLDGIDADPEPVSGGITCMTCKEHFPLWPEDRRAWEGHGHVIQVSREILGKIAKHMSIEDSEPQKKRVKKEKEEKQGQTLFKL